MERGMRDTLRAVMIGLEKHFTILSEFVLCERNDDGTQKVVSVVNPVISGLKAGDMFEPFGIEVESGQKTSTGRFNYMIHTLDGRLVRASTIRLRDTNGTWEGTLTLNSDVTEIRTLRNLMDNILQGSSTGNLRSAPPVKVDDILISIIRDSIAHVGAPVSRMTRDQKVEGIGYLHEIGAFKIKNSGNIVAKFYDISKYTIYNYLNELEQIQQDKMAAAQAKSTRK